MILSCSRPIRGSPSGNPAAISNCEAHDVEARHLFSDGVFDLDARVHFDEVEALRVGVVEELDGAGVVDAARAADGEGGGEDALPHVRRQVRRGCEFHHLLMPPLDGAVTLEQVNQPAAFVADELHFDVLGADDELLQEHVGNAERGSRLAAGGFDRFIQLVGAVNDAHSAPAAAHRRLHDDRVAELLGQRLRLGGGGERGVAAR